MPTPPSPTKPITPFAHQFTVDDRGEITVLYSQITALFQEGEVVTVYCKGADLPEIKMSKEQFKLLRDNWLVYHGYPRDLLEK